MLLTKWYVTVFTNNRWIFNISYLHYTLTLYHHPVLCAVVMVLQTKALSWMNRDALNLIAGLFFKSCVRAPRS